MAKDFTVDNISTYQQGTVVVFRDPNYYTPEHIIKADKKDKPRDKG